jgi:ComF family protein
MVPPPFTQAVAWGLYTGRTRELVHLFKYSGLLGLSHTLGRRVAEAANLFSNLPKEFTVTPVPLYRGKQRTRGFNQAALLAGASIRPMRELFPAHRIQLDERMLSRVRATESQAGLSPAERRRNLRAAFFVPKPERARGKHILLVDDIYTSGATARGCAEALLKAGALSVRVVTLSRAQREMAVHWDGMKEERQEAAAVF